jgi:hypothetical protein
MGRKVIDYKLLSDEDRKQLKQSLEQQKTALEAALKTTAKGLDDLKKVKTAKKAKAKKAKK